MNGKDIKEGKMKKATRILNYIIHKFIENPTKLSKVKLAKILYFADREYLYKYKEYLTNLEYIKLPYGPVVKGYDKILKDMQKDGFINEFTSIINNQKQTCFQSLKEPNISEFSPQEIEILDKAIYENYNKKATTLSKNTHDKIWENTETGNVIPLECVFLRDIQTPTQDDIQKAKQFLIEKNYIKESVL